MCLRVKLLLVALCLSFFLFLTLPPFPSPHSFPDEGTTPSDTIIDYNKVSSFQINLSSRFENKLLPYDLIIVRNHGDDDKDVGESLEAWWTSKGSQAELEAQSKSSLSLLRSPGTARTKINAHAAYGVRFGCSLYGWKDNFKELPMALV